MPYTSPTLTEAQIALASRLNDQDQVHWVEAELTGYLVEALRTWNAWTSHWRDRGVLTLANPDTFYDLEDLSGNLCERTVTNGQLVADLQYALLEPAAPFGTWSGTDQFTLEQLSTAIERRRDQFLRETGAIQTHDVITVTVPTNGRIALTEDVLIVRRAAFLQSGGGSNFNRPLLRTDDWAAQSYFPRWRTSTDPPRAYSVSDVPPLEFQFIPPGANGDLDLVSINKGPAVDPDVDFTLGIPNDWAWVIKYGALADLLNGDGLALDPQRAQYCEQRWQQGLDLCVRTPIVLNAYTASGAVMQLGALNEADKYSPTWQLVPGTPRRLLTAGLNLIASWPPPVDASPATLVTLDVVRNAPIPVNSGDVLQISSDVYDSILDIAQHTALFKQGPGELQLASALLERAARAAGIELQIQQASMPSRLPLERQQAQDGDAVPRESLTAAI